MQEVSTQLTNFIEFSPIPIESYYDFSVNQNVPSIYICWDKTIADKEATDEEILRHAAQSPAFAFLKEPEENIYTLEDGKPL